MIKLLHKTLGIILLMMGMWVSGNAQTATIRGKVTDGESGEVLLGATVRMFEGATMKGGAYTDLEGSYTITTAPGDYTLIISYVSYIDDTLQVAAAEEEVVFNETLLFQDMQIREDLKVEIVARASQASTVTLYNQKRNSINTIDGVSVDLIQRTGDPDVASAMQRITGVTVEGGKYVYVRGLGDRYSKSTLNGAELPSLDPNRNTVQMDIFPSNLIDNVIVYKNFTPDLPGNFAGGLIDVRTKDFPDRFQLNASASFGVNTQASFEDNFLTYQTGDTDWLGYDDGTRELPGFIQELQDRGGVPSRTFDASDAQTINDLDRASKSFDTPIFPNRDQSSLNQNYQISLGDQFNLFGRPFGYIASLTYRSNYNYYDDGQTGRWKNTSSPGNITETLNRELELDDEQGGREVLWGTLVKLSYKPRTAHKFSFNYMHNQSGSSSARAMVGPIPSDDFDLQFQTRTLGYIERSMDVFQLEGDHAFGSGEGQDAKFNMDWIASYTDSRQEEPDLRFFSNDFRLSSGDTIFDIQPNLYPPPNRFFRSLDEQNYDIKVNFEIPFQGAGDQQGKIKFGGAYTDRQRDFEELRFEFREGQAAERYNGRPAAYFAESNLGVFVESIGSGGIVRERLFVQDASEDRNAYDGEQTIIGVYAMAEIPFTARLKGIGGIRYEQTDATTTSRDADLDPGELDLDDFLPAAHLIFAIEENMNVRTGYARTLARPTFREFSPFVSFDFVGDFLLIGNPNLDRTLIDNFDLRWEWFPSPSELVTVSAFYKNFQDPIEKVINPEAANLELTYENVGSAEALGLEFEFRKTLEFLSPSLANFQLGGNASLIRSRVDIDADELALIQSVDPEREDRRPLYGQSPFAINAELAYVDDLDAGIRASLSYNIFGERISVVGGINPDVYEQPRGLLNFSIRKAFGNFAVRFRANNLLNPEYKQTQEYLGQEYIYQNYKVGTSYSLSLSYQIR